MDLSILYAQILGTTFTVTAVWLLLCRPSLRTVLADMQRQSFAVVSVAIFTLLLGVAMVFTHTVWDGTWRVLITVISWMILLKGVGFLLVPARIAVWAQRLRSSAWFIRIGGLASLLLGATLLYYGFTG